MKQKTGITPMLYTMYGFFPNFSSKELANYPLWIARYYDKANPGNSSIWSKWSMFQYSDRGSVKGIKGNVDVNAMSADFFKLINTGVSYVADANPPSSFRKGDSGLGVKELQQDLMKVGYKLPKYGADGGYGDETVEAVKKFQADNKLTSDGIAGEKTLALLADKVIEAEKPANLPPVTSLGDKYSFQVKANVDTGVYTYADLSKKNRVLSKDTVFSVYGFTTSAYAVGGGGFVKRSEVTPLPVTITTGGLSKDMEEEFRAFLKVAGIDAELNVHAEGNPSATLTVAGVQLALVRQFLDSKGWYYK
jgi:peptidoglycan hydrolase-like protein with peptidoglycan-binding domain